MIRLNNIHVATEDGREILRNISWQIEQDQNWVLFGRNGSGKTKLLEVLTGYLYPSSGEVIRFGQGQRGSDIRQIRKRIGYVSTALKTRFSRREIARDIVMSGLYASVGLYTEPAVQELRNAEDLLEAAGLGGRGGDPLENFSDGEQQKIMMSRAVINRPEILVLDEPAAGLDFASREDLLESLARMNALQRIPVVYVTHHVEEITPFFNRVFIIQSGACYFKGSVSDGLRSSVLSDLFQRDVEVIHRGERYSVVPSQKR